MTLACLATGKPLPSITWKRNGVNLSNGSLTTLYEGLVMEDRTLLAKSVVQICGAGKQVATEISCSADNGITNDLFNLTLTVISEGEDQILMFFQLVPYNLLCFCSIGVDKKT